MKYDFDDILLMPSIKSKIKSRYNDIDIYDKNNMLPIFTSPMIDVVDMINTDIFLENKINVIWPRGKYNYGSLHGTYNKFIAYGLKDFEKKYLGNFELRHIIPPSCYICIDIANGHQQQLIDVIKETKKIYGKNLVLMVGNVSNPKTYTELSNAGASFIRIGIGMGSGCLTTEQTGIGYPLASLIKDVYDESCSLENPAKIIADGGMRKYSDIIKALGLGSDGIMIGGIFNKCLESAGETYLWKYFKINQYSNFAKWLFKHNFKLYKKYRGQSAKEIQKILGNKILRTSEGITKFNHVRWTLESWVENFEHYLRSAMSYCNAKNLDEFIGKVDYNIISQNAYKRFNK